MTMNVQTKVKAETLAMAMAVAFGEIEGATKSSKNEGFKQGGKASKYADLTSVIEAIKPALVNNGLFFTQHPEPSDGGVCIETVLHHCGGESLSLGKLFVPADRSNAHGYGSALTYARRYALVTAFGVPVEDDDGNAASVAPKQQARREEMPDHEWSRLVQLVEATSANIPAMLKHLSIVVADNNLKLLNQDDYARVLDALNTKLAKMAKKQTDAKAKEPA
jgi:hypothetical protein